MKGELEELGEESEGVENISKMQGQILNMTDGAVNIFKDNGEFKSTYEIMDGIAEVYDRLSDPDKANLLETIAGKNHANTVAALIQNWDTAEKMVETAMNAEGSAAAENEKYLDSLQGRLDVMTSSLQAFSNAAMDSSLLKGGVSGITALINGITALVENIGLIPTVLGAAGAALGVFGKGMVTIDKSADGLLNKFNLFGKSLNDIGKSFSEGASAFWSGFGENKQDGLFAGLKGGIESILTSAENPFEKFQQQMDIDLQAFEKYKQRLAQGMSGDSLTNALAGSSDELQKNIAMLSEGMMSWDDFADSQKQSAVAVQASSKGLKSSAGIIKEYNSNCKNIGMTQKDFASAVSATNPTLGSYLSGLNGAKATMGGYATSLIGATAKTVALTVASTALNAALTMGIGVAITAAISGIASLITYYDDLAKSVEESSAAFKTSNDKLMQNKSSYESAVQSYDKLSQGVNKFGENVSLSSEEYEEYKNAVNTIANSAPSVVAGFDSQGNAILNTAENVNTLTQAYNELIAAEAKAYVEGDEEKGYVGGDKIFEDYIHDLESMQKDDLESYQRLNELLSSENIDQYIDDMPKSDMWNIRDRLKEMGLTQESGQSDAEFIAESIRNDTATVRKAVTAQMTEYENIASEAKQLTQSMLNEIMYTDDSFLEMNDSVKNMLTSYVSNLDGAFYEELVNKNDGNKNKALQGLQDYINSITESFAGLTETQQQTISDAFNMQVDFDSGNVTMKEFAAKAREMDQVLQDIGLDEDARKEMMLSLGFEYDGEGNLKQWTADYETALNRVQKETGIDKTKLNDWLGGLSGSELDMVMNMELEGVDTIDELQQALDLAKALNGVGSIDIELETDSLSKLNSAIQESNSATGLTMESIESVKSRYAEFENFDPSAVFEKTTTGVRLNTQALQALEKQYVANRKAASAQNINALATQYQKLGEQIEAASSAGDTAKANALKSQQSAVADAIEEAQMLAAAYDGMTSAYNEWVNAQSGGEQGDMYDNIVSAAEQMNEYASQGLFGRNDVQSYADMFFAEGATDNWDADDYSAHWRDVVNTQNRYLTEGRKGAENFINDIRDEFLQLNSDGDLELKPGVNIEDVAESLGKSNSLVEAMFKKANDYGFEFDIGVEQQSLDELVASSEQAAQEASNALKSALGEDFEISYDLKVNEDGTTNAEAELEKLKAKRDEINNSDATVEVKQQGIDAVNAQIESLIREKIQLEQPAFMKIDASQVNASLVDALGKVQEMQSAMDELSALNQMAEAKISVNPADIDAAKAKVDECAQALQGLDGDVKVAIGLEEDGSIESIKKSFTDGEVEIPIGADATDAKSATEELATNIDKIKDKDVTITAKVEGLDEIKDLGNVLDVAIKMDGETEDLTKYAEAAKALQGIDDTINKTATININGNLGDSFSSGPALNNIDSFVEKATKLQGVKDANVTITANLDGNIGGFAGFNPALNNLDAFAEASSKVEDIGDVEANVTANLNGNLGLNLGIGNLESFAEGAESLKNVESKSVTLTANLNGNLGLNAGVGNLETFAEGAEALKNVSSKEVNVTANLQGNIVDGSTISNLKQFADTAASLKSTSVSVNVDANTVAINNVKNSLQSLSDSGVMKSYTASIKTSVDTSAITSLQTAIAGVQTKTIAITASVAGTPAVTALQTAIANVTAKTVGVTANVTGTTETNALINAINRVNSKLVSVTAAVSGTSSVNALANAISAVRSKTVTVTTRQRTVSEANGTAHADGTANTGKAFKQGKWGAKESGTALMGELGPELIVRGDKFFTVGDNGAGFYQYKKGDIIFNHKQTEELLKNGYVTSNGGRGRAFLEGTAFASVSGGGGFAKPWGGGSGTTVINNNTTNNYYNGSKSSSKSSSSKSTKSSSSKSSSTKEADEFEETLDWIEIAIDRIERALDNLDKVASSTYRSWSERNAALNESMAVTRQEIDMQQQAYDRYMQEANSVGLSADWIEKIQNGMIDLETITDEALNDQISKYREYYEAALDSKDAVIELTEALGDLAMQRFENVQAQFDGILGSLEYEQSMVENFIDRAEVDGQFVSKNYYKFLQDNVHAQAEALRQQVKEMIAARDKAVNEGTMQVGDQAWDEMNNDINDVTVSIHKLGTQWAEYAKAIRETEWEIFDTIQDRISNINTEAQFLIDLMSHDKLFEDNGQFTDKGLATMGLYAQQYNVLMNQADRYAEEIKKIEEQMGKEEWGTDYYGNATNAFNQDIIDRYYELIEAQQEAILSAEEMKESIRDLVEEGIQLELDNLDDLIEKYLEALHAQEDLYEYQSEIESKTDDIASLRKQISAYENDTSEETQAKLQKLKDELEDAEKDLADTERQQMVSDIERLLDNLQLDYEEILNMRLDNIDALMQEMIAEANANSSLISDTISQEAADVGYTLSDEMQNIWNGEQDVLAYYGDNFLNNMTNISSVLNGISTGIQNMVNKLDSIANQKIQEAQNSNASKIPVTKPAPTPTPTTPSKPTTTEGDGVPKVGDKVKYVSGKYYLDSYGTSPLGSHNLGGYVYITRINSKGSHPYHISTGNKLGNGDLGWLKLNQISGYAIGKKSINDDEYAWTQENGKEMIVRPSDGAILTPLAKNDSVLTSGASSNIWNMANNPSDFIKDNLGLDNLSSPAANGGNTTITQNLDKVVFNLPNVKNYEEMLASMQKDRNFERLITAMTVDKIAGKNTLTKSKALR